MDETLDRALRYLEGSAPRQLLEVGCGTGEFLRRLRIRYPKAVLAGIDPAAGMLAVARRKLGDDPRLRVHGARAEALPFRSGRFDAVLCVNALHCVRGASGAMGEMARVLRSGGRLVAVDWCRDAWWGGLLDRWCRWVDASHVRMYTTEALQRMMDAAGVRVIRTERFRVSGPGPLRAWEMMACVAEKP